MNIPVFTLNSRSFAACLNVVVSGLDAQLWPFFHLLDFCFVGLKSWDGFDLPFSTLNFPITADKNVNNKHVQAVKSAIYGSTK